MITKKEYEEAKLIIQLYEMQNKKVIVGVNKKFIPPPPSPPHSRYLREGEEPPKPNIFRHGK